MYASLLANFGLFISLMDYERVIMEYDHKGLDLEKYPDAMQHPRVTNSITCLVRLIVLFTTIGAIGSLFMR